MRMSGQIHPPVLIVVLALAAWSCSKAKFSEGNGTSAVSTEDAKPADSVPLPEALPEEVPATTVEESRGCPAESILKRAFPPEVSACYESGRVWNFGTKACVQMRAAEFECNWDNVKAELANIGLKSGDIEKASQLATSRLMGCGQSADKMRVVVQWIDLPSETTACSEIKANSVVTGCFTNYGTSTPPAPAANQAERDKRNYECMSAL